MKCKKCVSIEPRENMERKVSTLKSAAITSISAATSQVNNKRKHRMPGKTPWNVEVRWYGIMSLLDEGQAIQKYMPVSTHVTPDQECHSRKFAKFVHDGKIKAGPLDLSFWSFLTFLHHSIEQVETHLLWKFHKKIQRKSWSNVPPKLVTCIGFLYKVVHTNGRLRKFNGAREI